MHPLLMAAAEGRYPDWAQLGDWRRQHAARVATLMGEWATQLAPGDEPLWRAAGYLHDVLRDAPAEQLRISLGGRYSDWPAPLLHAPAAAERLQQEGVTDHAFLLAIGYHPLGWRELDLLGRALYLADFIEPGRSFAPEYLGGLRARMPHEFDQVLREVTAFRIRQQLETNKPIRVESLEFWNAQVSRNEHQ